MTKTVLYKWDGEFNDLVKSKHHLIGEWTKWEPAYICPKCQMPEIAHGEIKREDYIGGAMTVCPGKLVEITESEFEAIKRSQSTISDDGSEIFIKDIPNEQGDEALKCTIGKTPWSIFPWREAEEVVKVFDWGRQPEQYGRPFSYREGIDPIKLAEATVRHAIAILEGEHHVPKSKLFHAAHIAANGLMIISQYER